MKRNILWLGMLAMVLAFGMTVIGCDNGSTDDNGGGSTGDSVTIRTVTPNANLTDGVEQNFTVTVDYRLSTLEQGKLSIAFNTVNVNQYQGALSNGASSTVTVNKGSGNHTFNVTNVVPKNWAPAGEFEVVVDLLPVISQTVITVLAFDRKALSFGSDSNTGGTFTLTNIPAQYNGKYAAVGAVTTGGVNLLGFQSVNFSTQTFTSVLISNGSVSVPMFTALPGAVQKYSGNDTTQLEVNIYNNATTTGADTSVGRIAKVSFGSVTFSNGNAAKSFNDGTLQTY